MKKIILSLFIGAFLFGGFAPHAHALSPVNPAVTMTRMKERGTQEIDRRIAALSAAKTRINAMVKVSAADKASFSASIDAQVSILSTLKDKINADTDLETLKTDVKSITGSYRIFALILPRLRLLAAADRMETIADMMTDLSTNLSTRITEAGAAGNNVTALTAALTDLNAKIADAKVQYDAVEGIVIPLNPDQGNDATFQANKNSLISARAKIKAGGADLKVARQDIKTIREGLRAMNPGTVTP